MAENFINTAKDCLKKHQNIDIGFFSYDDWDDIKNCSIRHNSMPKELILNGGDSITAYLHDYYKIYGVWSALFKRKFLIKNKYIGRTFIAFLLNALSAVRYVGLFDIQGYYYVRRTTRETGMNRKFFGYEYFSSIVNNIYYITNLISSNKKNNVSINFIKKFFTEPRKKERFLSYVFKCIELGISSPINNEQLSKICSCKEYLRVMLMDYSKTIKFNLKN